MFAPLNCFIISSKIPPGVRLFPCAGNPNYYIAEGQLFLGKSPDFAESLSFRPEKNRKKGLVKARTAVDAMGRIMD
jgi:hypothetical protein